MDIVSDFPPAKYVNLPEGKMAYYEAGPATALTPPLILVHGWPEIAYSWKNQLHILADAGYRVIALDLKGFGQSSAPKDPALYNIQNMTNDLCLLLDALAIEKAIFCGHDWGGAIVWPMSVLYSDRVAGIIGICTPHLPAPPVAPLSIIEKRFGQDHYFIQFQRPGEAEQIFTGQEDKFFQIMFRHPAPKSAWASLMPRIFNITGRLKNGPAPAADELIVDKSVLDIYISAYKQSGFHGGINLYRNIDKNWSIMKDRNLAIKQPALWIGAELDMFLPPEATGKMDALVPDLERHVLPDCGHWVMWEKPDSLNALLLNWLQRRFPPETP